MAMIKEAYVSFEVAKLLKEKGFNEPIRCWYDNFQDFHEEGVRMSNSDCLPPTIMCPTQAMAMAWLREDYEISIEVSALKRHRWVYTIYRLLEERVVEVWNDGTYVSYEDATDDALKYCLENLNKLT